MLTPEQPLRDFPWSSYREYLQAPDRRVPWLRVGRLLGEMGIQQDTAAGRRQFELMMGERRGRDEPGDWKAIRRGWCLGDEQFRKELLEQMSEPMGRQHYGGVERQETEEAKAEHILAGEQQRRKWSRKELAQRRKGDKEKVKIAGRLRSETTMTLNWIAERLSMGVAGYAAQCLRAAKPGNQSVLLRD